MTNGYNVQQKVLREPFNVEVHKQTFIDYLEAVVSPEGTVMYAVPSHQEKLIAVACNKFNKSRDELWDSCPPEYYFSVLEWLCEITGYVLLWTSHMIGQSNEKQLKTIQHLKDEGLFLGSIS